MTLLSVDDLHVHRGGTAVLHGVSFHVAENEVVALLGSNGAGKSTTLRTISGLHRPSRGRVTFDGADLTGRSPRDVVHAGISHVPEGRQIFPALTVRENLLMGAYSAARSRSDLASAIERFPDLERALSEPAATLSGGQQQMLAIARGLLSQPKLLILDEPSLGLAPIVVRSIAKIIRDLCDAGTPVLLVEQNTRLALDVADRGYVIADGAAVTSGAAAELRSDDRIRRAYLGL